MQRETGQPSLENAAQSALVFDASLRLKTWSERHVEQLALPAGFAVPGLSYAELIRFHARQGAYGAGDVQEKIRARLDSARRRARTAYACACVDGKVLQVCEHPLHDGGLMMIYTDVCAPNGVGMLRPSRTREPDVEVVAQLADGVAHDFNNLLTAIMMNVGFLEDLPGMPADSLQVVQIALSAARRAADFTDRLRAFSRAQDLRPEVVDVPELMAHLSDELERALGSEVELRSSCADEVWPVFADPRALCNALLEVAANAREAKSVAGARLDVHVANVVVQRDPGSTGETSPDSGWVLFTVSDNGRGMPRCSLERVFEPFFSTKERGPGHGLGLSAVYVFARQSGGDLEILSEEGEGTVVKLYLPATSIGRGASDIHDTSLPPGRRPRCVVQQEDADGG